MTEARGHALLGLSRPFLRLSQAKRRKKGIEVKSFHGSCHLTSGGQHLLPAYSASDVL